MKKISIAFIAVSTLLFSCNDFNKSIQDTLSNSDSTATAKDNTPPKQTTAKAVTTIEVPFTSQKDKLAQAEKQLRALPQFVGKTIYIYKLVHFYDDGRIITKLQNPDNPNYIDSYQYEDGKWQDPQPVVLSKHDEIKKNLMRLDRLPFVNVVNVYNVLMEKRIEINSNSNDYTIYAFTQNDEINWYPNSVGNDRSVYEIEYNEDGTLHSFVQQ